MEARNVSAGIILKGNTLEFVWENTKEDIISLSPGKGKLQRRSPYLKKNLEYPIYSVFMARDKDSYADVIKALKGKPTDLLFDPDDKAKLIRKGSLFIKKVVEQFEPDMIVAMPSSGTAVREFIKDLQSIMSLPPVVYKKPSVVRKNPTEDIWIAHDTPEPVRKKLEGILASQIKKGFETLEVKNIEPKDRKFLRNVFELNMPIEDQRILVVDDTLTTGFSLGQTFSILATVGIEDACGITLFKGS